MARTSHEETSPRRQPGRWPPRDGIKPLEAIVFAKEVGEVVGERVKLAPHGVVAKTIPMRKGLAYCAGGKSSTLSDQHLGNVG